METNKNYTEEEIQELVAKKTEELEFEHKTTILPLLFNHKGNWIVGYVKKPSRTTIRVAGDKMEKYGKLEAGELILQTSLLRDVSDSRILSEEPQYDGINLGACLEVLSLMDISMSIAKKNSTNL